MQRNVAIAAAHEVLHFVIGECAGDDKQPLAEISERLKEGAIPSIAQLDAVDLQYQCDGGVWPLVNRSAERCDDCLRVLSCRPGAQVERKQEGVRGFGDAEEAPADK